MSEPAAYRGQSLPHPRENAGMRRPGNDATYGTGGAFRQHRCAVVAIAEDFVQLSIRDAEEPLGFAIGIVFEADGAKDRIIEGDRDWRIGATQRVTRRIALVLGAVKGVQTPVRLRLQKLCPALQTLALRQNWSGDLLDAYLRNSRELLDCFVFHELASTIRVSTAQPLSRFAIIQRETWQHLAMRVTCHRGPNTR